MKLSKLLNKYGLDTRRYYEMVLESHINGNFDQARIQFNAMTKDDKKIFLSAYLVGELAHPATSREYVFFFGQL